MVKIPQPLVDSLMGLGLLESEARIYTAIVLLGKVEVKDLIGFLGLSKPSIYTGFRSLEERGLIMLTSPKPATYQALPPEVALDILMTTHKYHKEKALHLLRNLENEYLQDNSQASLWYTLGYENIESKIVDMLANAKEKVICYTSGKYLDILEGSARRSIDFQFVILSDDNAIQGRLELIFKKSRASIRTIRKGQAINFIADTEAGDRQDKKLSLLDELNMLDFAHTFALITDDSECLVIPPLMTEPRNAMVTKNKAMILNIKLMMKMMSDGPRI